MKTNALNLFLLCLMPFVLIATPVANEAESETPINPPNDWGTYYSFTGEKGDFRIKFEKAYAIWMRGSDANNKIACPQSSAVYSRYYRDFNSETRFIYSFFCQAKDRYGYEHLIVNGETVEKWSDSLKGFGILDAGDYKSVYDAEGAAAGKVQTELFDAVKEEIEALELYGSKVCEKPSLQTFYRIKTKTENDLSYTEFPVACAQGNDTNAYMMEIEVVEDKKYQRLNEGNPLLVSNHDPIQNDVYKKQAELMKQSTAALLSTPIPTIILTTFISLCLAAFM